MPDATYNAQAIFGLYTKQTGPVRPYRAMRSQLPTVNGVRVYRLGKDTQTWVVRGRLVGGSVAALITAINAANTLVDGQTRTFVDVGGNNHANCVLNDFRQIGQFATITLANGAAGATVVVQGTVEQLSPDV